jgi:nucleoside-diphosphate-sugar epimerase
MRIFLAGASGALGRQLVPTLVGAGHVVAGMTRTPGNAEMLQGLGAQPVVCDVYDAARLRVAVADFAPDLVMHQLTDLPDDPQDIPAAAPANNRIRREGTRNLLDAAAAAGVGRFLAQSVAWELPGEGGAAVAEHERAVLDAGGVVVRYGRFYGPGTYHEHDVAPPPCISVANAALVTLSALEAPSGIVLAVDDPAPGA